MEELTYSNGKSKANSKYMFFKMSGSDWFGLVWFGFSILEKFTLHIIKDF